MNLLENIKKSINNYIKLHDSILVCVSGGPDSMALLDILFSLKETYKLSLYVVHFNHKLRGKESKNDETAVKKAAERYKLPFILGSKDIKKEAKKQKQSMEKTARDERYRFFIKNACKHKANKIALAHTKDDNIETVLFRFIHGSGVSGLKGIPAQRRIMPGDFGCNYLCLKYPGVHIIRPIMSFYKKDILQYLKEENIKFNIDRTNLGVVYGRNRIRNRLIPLIEKEYNRNFKENISNAAEILTEEDQYLEDIARKISAAAVSTKSKTVIIDKKTARLHRSIRMRIIKLALEKVFKHKRNINFRLINTIDSLLKENRQGTMVLPENILLESDLKNVVLKIAAPETIKQKEIFVDNLKTKQKFVFNNRELSFEEIQRPEKFEFHDKSTAWLDISKIKLPLNVRERKDGDRFMPYGLGKVVRLKKYLNTHKIEAPVIIVKDKEKILWLAGERVDERYKIDENTKKVLKITINKE